MSELCYDFEETQNFGGTIKNRIKERRKFLIPIRVALKSNCATVRELQATGSSRSYSCGPEEGIGLCTSAPI